MGYLVLVHDGPGALPDGQICWDVAVATVSCHLEIQVDMLAGELYLEFFTLLFWGPYKRYMDMEAGFPHRILIQIL